MHFQIQIFLTSSNLLGSPLGPANQNFAIFPVDWDSSNSDLILAPDFRPADIRDLLFPIPKN